jgi:hypothetical protein
MTTIPNTYDAIMAPHLGVIPIGFAKSLAWHESSFKPDARPVGKDGKLLSSAVGLFQPLKATTAAFAQATGKPYTQADMTDPAKNAEVGLWLLNRIVAAYAVKHPKSLAMDWSSPVYASMVALGYVVGESDKQGVGAIVGRMEGTGLAPGPKLNLPNVLTLAGATWPKLAIYNDGHGAWSDPALASHVAKIVRDYRALAGLPPASPASKSAPLPPPGATGPDLAARRKPSRAGMFGFGFVAAALAIAVANARG